MTSIDNVTHAHCLCVTPLLPTITAAFVQGDFPLGELLDHPKFSSFTDANLRRTTMDEMRLRDILIEVLFSQSSTLKHHLEDQIKDLREAAESHRQTRAYVQSWIKPGMVLRAPP